MSWINSARGLQLGDDEGLLLRVGAEVDGNGEGMRDGSGDGAAD